MLKDHFERLEMVCTCETVQKKPRRLACFAENLMMLRFRVLLPKQAKIVVAFKIVQGPSPNEFIFKASRGGFESCSGMKLMKRCTLVMCIYMCSRHLKGLKRDLLATNTIKRKVATRA